MKYVASVDNREFEVEILAERRIAIDGKVYQVDFESVGGQPVYSLLIDGKSFEGLVYPHDDAWQVLLHGTLYTILVEDERDRRLRSAAGESAVEHREYHLKAPMPGLIVSIPIKEGQQIAKGDVLLILESMKMQNELKSPRPGVISRIRVKPGDRVDQKQILVIVD